MRHRFLHAFSILMLALVAQPASAAITAGMSVDDMVADIVAAAREGAGCKETMAAITTAVELDNANAPELVLKLAARKDTGCYDDLWLVQRLAARIESAETPNVMYADRPCYAPYAVVRAAVSGFEEVNEPGDAEVKAETLAPKILGVLESAGKAVGEDIPGRSCTNVIVAAAVAGVEPGSDGF